MRIAVYSGSFNPLHIGHQAIMEYLTRSGDYDWVYLVVSPQNPFKGAEKRLNARERFEAAVEAVRRHPELRVWVDDIEFSMDPPHYTIRTLDALREREPDNQFALVIGADNLVAIDRWKDAERLLESYEIAVYPRNGYDATAQMDRLSREYPCRIRLIDAPLTDISSTQIREALKLGKDMSEWLM